MVPTHLRTLFFKQGRSVSGVELSYCSITVRSEEADFVYKLALADVLYVSLAAEDDDWMGMGQIHISWKKTH